MVEPVQASARYRSPEWPLLLASASPRRNELLRVLLDEFEVRPADIDERRAGTESPDAYALRLAREKAAAVARKASGRWVLGSDTVVVRDGCCLGKPQDLADAVDTLRSLSGRSHQVFSAVALVGPDQAASTGLSLTRVCFAAMPDDWIQAYAESGEPMDKAGSYAIQGRAAAWVERIDGSYSGVVGLPLYETARLLRDAGVL